MQETERFDVARFIVPSNMVQASDLSNQHYFLPRTMPMATLKRAGFHAMRFFE